jgi:hypothetical protein
MSDPPQHTEAMSPVAMLPPSGLISSLDISMLRDWTLGPLNGPLVSIVPSLRRLTPPEQAAEDVPPELERLIHRRTRASRAGIRLDPRPQIVFRPEEVELGSERR